MASDDITPDITPDVAPDVAVNVVPEADGGPIAQDETPTEVTLDFDFFTNGTKFAIGTHTLPKGIADDLKRRNDDMLEQERYRFTGRKINVDSGSIDAAGK